MMYIYVRGEHYSLRFRHTLKNLSMYECTYAIVSHKQLNWKFLEFTRTYALSFSSILTEV